MPNEDDKRYQMCQQQFKAIRNDQKSDNKVIFTKLDGIDKLLRGNGQPGMMVRVDRLEQEQKTRSKFVWLIVVAIITMTATSLVAAFT